MKKLAIFVEGQTELIFIDKFLREFISSSKLVIESVEASGGRKYPRFTTLIASEIPTPETKYEILIFNSCTDNRVITDIRERYEGLKENGYSHFIGLRDLYRDYLYSEKDEALEDAQLVVGHFENTTIIYATMEIETWFIAEFNHYENINKNLTLKKIKEELLFDLENITNIERFIVEPAKKLDQIYQLVNLNYTKNSNITIDSLDYENLYLNTKEKVPSLKKLIIELDNFFIE
ncbi:MAG: hypothetical protein Q9M36_04785 [Sulfurovum sp.]|nr:hypothetical protein [Sulfurovum sp.]